MGNIKSVLLTAVLAAVAASAGAAGDMSKRGYGDRGTVDARAGAGAIGGGAAAADAAAVAGGVGIEARQALQSQTPPHNVKMVFSLNTGNYLADVHVKVTDRSGNVVLDGVSDGPWLYAQLPPGTYNATATYNGKTVTRRFSVSRSGQRTAHFRWPASVEVGLAADVNQILGTGPQTVR